MTRLLLQIKVLGNASLRRWLLRRDLNEVKERTIKVSVERVSCSEGASWSGGYILVIGSTPGRGSTTGRGSIIVRGSTPVRGSSLGRGSIPVRGNISEKALDLGSAWYLRGMARRPV